MPTSSYGLLMDGIHECAHDFVAGELEEPVLVSCCAERVRASCQHCRSTVVVADEDDTSQVLRDSQNSLL
jgi:hypothetical protein